LNAHEEGLDAMRRNVDAWWPEVEAGAEAIVMTASGCGAMVVEYGHLLRHDARYAERAARISALTRDLSQVMETEADALAALLGAAPRDALAFHAPCTLQHGLKLKGRAEALLARLGYPLTPVPDAHLCCGSAGTYSILQKELSQQLLRNKVAALDSGRPRAIATANIGCLMHLQSGTQTPVRHWIEVVDRDLAAAC
jgi:glycolate oxidase iron-sulfur subunit